MAIIKFNNPPLVEVALGVELEDTNFSSVHLGLYWQEIRDRFPEWAERPPVIMRSNDDDDFLPPLRRISFISSDTKKLVQLQDNFFGYNWRYKNSRDYPHFENLFQGFLQEWNYLQGWWSKVGESPLKPSRYELTYANLIDKNSGWNNSGDHQKIFRFVSSNWNDFLKTPDYHDIQLIYSLPNDEGRLIVEVDQRLTEGDDSSIVIFQLTAVSFDASKSLVDWFRDTHSYIIKAFLSLTEKEAQDKWGRYDT